MPVIKVENLSKEFRQRKGREGLAGAIKDLFDRKYNIIKAVDNISYTVEKGEIVGYNLTCPQSLYQLLCGSSD